MSRGGGIGAQSAQQLDAVEPRHHDVGEDQIGPPSLDRVERRATVGDGLDRPAVREQALQILSPHVGVVVGQENSRAPFFRARRRPIDRACRPVGVEPFAARVRGIGEPSESLVQEVLRHLKAFETTLRTIFSHMSRSTQTGSSSGSQSNLAFASGVRRLMRSLSVLAVVLACATSVAAETTPVGTPAPGGTATPVVAAPRSEVEGKSRSDAAPIEKHEMEKARQSGNDAALRPDAGAPATGRSR